MPLGRIRQRILSISSERIRMAATMRAKKTRSAQPAAPGIAVMMLSLIPSRALYHNTPIRLPIPAMAMRQKDFMV